MVFQHAERMLGVDERGLAVAQLMEEEAEVQVVSSTVSAESRPACSLGDDDRLARQLDGGLLLIQLVVDLGQRVVHLGNLGMEQTVDLLVQ